MTFQFRTCVASIVVVLVSTTCSDSVPTPSAPSANVPAVAGIALSGPSFAFLNQPTPLRAVLTLADGRQVEAEKVSWSSVTPAIAIVDERGRVTGKTSGIATIRAERDGHFAQIALGVIPDYGGSWRGEYEVVCPEGCGKFQRPGSIIQLTLALEQTNNRVKGTLTIGGLEGDVEGQIEETGTLRLFGAIEPEDRYHIREWATSVVNEDGTAMGGRFRYLNLYEIEAKNLSLRKSVRR